MTDDSWVVLPDEVNVSEFAEGVWKLTVPGRGSAYSRGLLVYAGCALADCVQAVEYLARCVRQEEAGE